MIVDRQTLRNFVDKIKENLKQNPEETQQDYTGADYDKPKYKFIEESRTAKVKIPIAVTIGYGLEVFVPLCGDEYTNQGYIELEIDYPHFIREEIDYSEKTPDVELEGE